MCEGTSTETDFGVICLEDQLFILGDSIVKMQWLFGLSAIETERVSNYDGQ